MPGCRFLIIRSVSRKETLEWGTSAAAGARLRRCWCTRPGRCYLQSVLPKGRNLSGGLNPVYPSGVPDTKPEPNQSVDCSPTLTVNVLSQRPTVVQPEPPQA